MISDAKSGGFQYIAVYMFDCFKRNRRESILCKEMLKENVIKVISVLGPIAEDEGGEFYGMFLEWIAEKYCKRLSKTCAHDFPAFESNVYPDSINARYPLSGGFRV